MNSDPLNQLWQQQPLPTARAYRAISERSFEMRTRIDALDGARATTVFVGLFALWIGCVGFEGYEANFEQLGIRLPLAVGGLALVIWTLGSWWQRRRLRWCARKSLLGELDDGILRIRQNERLHRWCGWLFPILFFVQGVWQFWPEARVAHALTTGDWIWSGSFILVWLVLAVVFVRNARARGRKLVARAGELTALRDELLALELPAAER